MFKILDFFSKLILEKVRKCTRKLNLKAQKYTENNMNLIWKFH